MLNIKIELNEKQLTELIMKYLSEMIGETPISREDVKIEVKSKQNYKAEWEKADFRAIVEKTVL